MKIAYAQLRLRQASDTAAVVLFGAVGPLLGFNGFLMGREHDFLQTGGGTGSAVAHGGHRGVGRRDGGPP
ncbi:hypothetical protein ABVB69_37770 [Streptomyces sp. NPDC000349]|uniref:hypothetical protein n=1 Tax=Streptomyces sp. NPDC000349 TaxID=3154249 RepID=UPI00336A4790